MSDFHDNVAVFEALDEAIDDLANPLAVLVEYIFALGLTDLLEDNLLRGLRCDSSQYVSWLWKFDFHAGLGFVSIKLLSLDDGDLGRWIGYFRDNLSYGKQLDLAGFRIEFRTEIFVRLVVFPRRR